MHAVGLACYAPMFANVDYVNWRPDMIWFDNHQVYGSVNYYVQSMFMRHQGTHRLDFTVQSQNLSRQRAFWQNKKSAKAQRLSAVQFVC